MTVELWKKVLKRTGMASLLLAVYTLTLQISCFGMVVYIDGYDGHSEMVEADSMIRVDSMLEPILYLSAAFLVCIAIELCRQHLAQKQKRTAECEKEPPWLFSVWKQLK